MVQSSSRLVKLVVISLLSSIAFIMQYLDFPLPPFPPYLKVDFSDVPALFAGFMFGPWIGVLVEFLKNTLHFLFSGSETGIPIGNISNFIAGSVFVVSVVLTARRINGVKGVVAGFVVGTLVMAALLAVMNYYVLFPAYAYLLNMPFEADKLVGIVLYGITPFNVIKGLLIALVFVPIYMRLQPRLERRITV